MCFGCTIKYGVVGVGLLSNTSTVLPNLTIQDYSAVRATVSTITLPELEQPAWLKEQVRQEKARRAVSSSTPTGSVQPVSHTVTYHVETRGTVMASVAEFKQQANQTLNDSRGWRRMGVSFREVPSGGMFTLVLAAAKEVPKFAPGGCSSDLSCRVGRYVIINQDRWLGATSPWNASGGSLRDYRHMVINHETGHWLGHGHQNCQKAGAKAPVMQQQSANLQGCTFNPWPLDSELWSTQLGISR